MYLILYIAPHHCLSYVLCFTARCLILKGNYEILYRVEIYLMVVFKAVRFILIFNILYCKSSFGVLVWIILDSCIFFSCLKLLRYIILSDTACLKIHIHVLFLFFCPCLIKIKIKTKMHVCFKVLWEAPCTNHIFTVCLFVCVCVCVCVCVKFILNLSKHIYKKPLLRQWFSSTGM